MRKTVRTKDDDPCAFCGGAGPLRDSHVLPEFMYDSIYSAKHRGLGIKASADGTAEAVPVQKGLREPLLCQACESYFNDSFERPCVDAWRDLDSQRGEIVSATMVTSPDEKGRRLFQVEGLDYRTTKLLLLSVIWRAGVAMAPEYARVGLSEHEDRLRKMLADGDPGSPTDYPCCLVILRPEGMRTVIPPWRIRFDRIRGYRFVTNALVPTILVTRGARSRILDPFFLRPDRPWLALSYRPEDEPAFRRAAELTQRVPHIPEPWLEG